MILLEILWCFYDPTMLVVTGKKRYEEIDGKKHEKKHLLVAHPHINDIEIEANRTPIQKLQSRDITSIAIVMAPVIVLNHINFDFD